MTLSLTRLNNFISNCSVLSHNDIEMLILGVKKLEIKMAQKKLISQETEQK